MPQEFFSKETRHLLPIQSLFHVIKTDCFRWLLSTLCQCILHQLFCYPCSPLILFSCSLRWQTEVKFLRRLSHLNIVKLLGYCRGECERLLVYEFMAMGSLENHLFRSKAFKF